MLRMNNVASAHFLELRVDDLFSEGVCLVAVIGNNCASGDVLRL